MNFNNLYAILVVLSFINCAACAIIDPFKDDQLLDDFQNKSGLYRYSRSQFRWMISTGLMHPFASLYLLPTSIAIVLKYLRKRYNELVLCRKR